MPHVVRSPKNPDEPKGPRVVKPQRPQPSSSSVSPIGRWNGFHPKWQLAVEINANGTFLVGGHGSGAWAFDGRYLTLTWAQSHPNEVLELQPDGTFHRMCPEGSFTLRPA